MVQQHDACTQLSDTARHSEQDRTWLMTVACLRAATMLGCRSFRTCIKAEGLRSRQICIHQHLCPPFRTVVQAGRENMNSCILRVLQHTCRASMFFHGLSVWPCVDVMLPVHTCRRSVVMKDTCTALRWDNLQLR